MTEELGGRAASARAPEGLGKEALPIPKGDAGSGPTSSTLVSAGRRGPRGAWRGALRTLVLTPAFLWILLLIIFPDVYLVMMSFWTTAFGSIDHTWTTQNYAYVLSHKVITVTLQRTVIVAVVSAALGSLIAYPLAYIVHRRFRRLRLMAVLLVVVPLWVSYLMRIFSWRIILGPNGILNSLLVQSGILDHPSGAFLYSTGAVILAFTYVSIPYVFLTTYVMLERIPDSMYEASQDCGASPWRTMGHVILPLTRPGLIIGFSFAFILAFGDYVTPAMVGGLSGTMVGSIVLQEFGYVDNWALGAALGVVILVTGLLILSFASLFTRSEARFEY